ncbi:MAG: YkgJ family cysteine cluster protein [Chloroflexi bacterium]|nr:YkgJ family cysteine cluster protein [Chloroflexota bacterium]
MNFLEQFMAERSGAQSSPLERNLADEVIAARVRVRALLELLEEKGLLAPGEFDQRAALLWERDYEDLRRELEGLPSQAEAEATLADRPDHLVCAVDCGALCCRSSCIPLTDEEIERMRRLAAERGIADLEIVDEGSAQGKAPAWIMLSFPCKFLTPDSRCSIYDERPEHCRQFPWEWRDECLLSHKRFETGTATLKLLTMAGPHPDPLPQGERGPGPRPHPLPAGEGRQGAGG